MSGTDLFEYIVELPDAALSRTSKGLVGFSQRYEKLEKNLRLMSDPESLRAWARKHYSNSPRIAELLIDRYPLFIFAGDVGTGKTAFAKCAASRLVEQTQTQGTLFGLSTRVRGEGRVGEASSRLNSAFNLVRDSLGKAKLSVLLIDEADSLVSDRADEHSHLEDKVAVNTIIQKIDELRDHGGRLIVFLATNRLESLDPAIVRRAAVVNTFARPTALERAELLTADLDGLGLASATIAALVEKTGATNERPAFTFSDIRTRLLPEIVLSSFPTRKITDDDALQAVGRVIPSPVIK